MTKDERILLIQVYGELRCYHTVLRQNWGEHETIRQCPCSIARRFRELGVMIEKYRDLAPTAVVDSPGELPRRGEPIPRS